MSAVPGAAGAAGWLALVGGAGPLLADCALASWLSLAGLQVLDTHAAAPVLDPGTHDQNIGLRVRENEELCPACGGVPRRRHRLADRSSAQRTHATMLSMLVFLRGLPKRVGLMQEAWLASWAHGGHGVDAVHAANQELNVAFGLADGGEPPGAHSANAQQAHFQKAAPPNSVQGAGEQQQQQRMGHAVAGLPAQLTHVDERGWAHMVDVSDKSATRRSAQASCLVLLGSDVFQLVEQNLVGKGNVLSTAQLAGIMAAKQTSTLIPLCHNIPLSKVSVNLELDPEQQAVQVCATATTVASTGVEMEALVAASAAALTVYDMCKSASKAIEITALRLEHKSGGKSGEFVRRR